MLTSIDIAAAQYVDFFDFKNVTPSHIVDNCGTFFGMFLARLMFTIM